MKVILLLISFALLGAFAEADTNGDDDLNLKPGEETIQVQGNARGWLEDAISTVSDAVKAANSNSEKARNDLANTVSKASESARNAIQDGINAALKTLNGTLENIRQAQNATRASLG